MATWRRPGIHSTICFVARWILRCAIAHHSSRYARPGMTAGHALAFSRRMASEVCIIFLPKKREQGRPGARCTRGLACNCAQRTRTRAYRFSGNTPAFPAQWLYGLLRALPGERLFCHRRRSGMNLHDLTPAPRRQDHTTSPYASCGLVCHAIRVHRIPPHVRDDHDPPLDWVRRAELCR